MKNIIYKKENDSYYKINTKSKKIIKIENNEIENIEYDNNIEYLLKLKSVPMNEWKHIENTFFISRDFEWEYNGEKFKTNNEPIKWIDGDYGSRKANVFHNGKIWEANYSANYYPRIFMTQLNAKIFTLEKVLNGSLSYSKWTDIKYCKNFVKIL